jgi:hypothetical protein
MSTTSTAFPLRWRVFRCRSEPVLLVARAASRWMRRMGKSMPPASLVVVPLVCALLAGCPSGGSEPKNPPQAPPAPLKPAILGQFVSADAGTGESAGAHVPAKDVKPDAGSGPTEHVDAAAPPATDAAAREAADAAEPPMQASQPSEGQ